MSFKKITLIGSGRVATQLGKRLAENGRSIAQVYSRNPDHARKLATMIGAEPISDFQNLDHNADLFIVSVVDDAISEIAQNLHLHQKPVVHTSGSVHINTLKGSSAQFGVFYPLQTFAKDKDVNFLDIPICIEATSKGLESQLKILAQEISNDVRLINSGQRMLIHIAAVFVNNFTNFMYLMGEDILKDAGVSFDILLPLIRETADKIKSILPDAAQTGPALRGDFKVMEKHLKTLDNHPEKKEVYRQISHYISAHFRSQIKKTDYKSTI